MQGNKFTQALTRFLAFALVHGLSLCQVACGQNADPSTASSPPATPSHSSPAAATPPTPELEWTDLALPAGARATYISSTTGSDINPGTEASPLKSVRAGYARLRDGHPDQLLLKCGDIFTLPDTFALTKASGFVSGKYMVIGSYGNGPRPKVTGPKTMFNGESFGKRGLAIVGIEFVGDRQSDGLALRFLGWSNVLIEDCSFHDLHRAIAFQGFNARSTGFRFRRNIAYDITSDGCIGTNCPQALYMDTTDDWVIEENFFDKCGIPGSMHSRPVYCQDTCGPGLYARNVMARCPAEGVQVRAGGTVIDNLVLRCPIGIFVGRNPAGDNEIAFNTIIESGDIGPGAERGRGIHFSGSSTVHHNILYMNTGRGDGSVHGIFANQARGTIASNWIMEWTRSPDDRGPGDSTEAQAILIDGGQFKVADNRVFSVRQGIVLESRGSITGTGNVFAEPSGKHPTFRPQAKMTGWSGGQSPPDPKLRESLPGGGIDAYAELIRLQSRQSWREDLTAGAINAAARKRIALEPNP